MIRKSTSEKRDKCSLKHQRKDGRRPDEHRKRANAGLSPEEKIELLEKARARFQDQWGLWIM